MLEVDNLEINELAVVHKRHGARRREDSVRARQPALNLDLDLMARCEAVGKGECQVGDARDL